MQAQVKPQRESNNRKLHVIYLVIIFLLAGLCGFLAVQYKQLKTVVSVHEIQVQQVVEQKEDVIDDLKELKDQYSQLQTSDANLNLQLAAKKAMIDSLLIQAEKHKGDAYIIAKLKKETGTLRTIMQ